MNWFQDLDTHTKVAPGDPVRAIGWLAADKPIPQGEVVTPSPFLLPPSGGTVDKGLENCSDGPA